MSVAALMLGTSSVLARPALSKKAAPLHKTMPLRVTVELLHQPIGHRWARNVGGPGTAETDHFVRRFAALGPATATVVASASAVVAP